MKSKQKEKPVGLKKLQALEGAFLKKQEGILNELLTAIKKGEKSKVLKTLVKKFEKSKNKLSLLLDEISKVEKAEVKKNVKEKTLKLTKKKGSIKADKTKKLAKKGSGKSAEKSSMKVVVTKPAENLKKPAKKTTASKPTVSKAKVTKPKVFKVSKVAATKATAAESKSTSLNTKLAVAAMQEIKTSEELDQFLIGETRVTVLKRAGSRRNALSDL